MREEQQSIDTKCTQSTIKQQEKKQNVRQTKQGFLIKRCLPPLSICISPMAFSPYECAWGRISHPKNVHMSHIEMMIHSSILSSTFPLFVMNRQTNQEEGGKEKKIWTMVKDDAWGVQDERENKAQMKDKNI